MHDANLLTGWDTAILMVPFLGLLAFWMFGLDERVAAPRVRSPGRSFCQAEGNGKPHGTDPDGKPWRGAPEPTLTAPSPSRGGDPFRRSGLRVGEPAEVPLQNPYGTIS